MYINNHFPRFKSFLTVYNMPMYPLAHLNGPGRCHETSVMGKHFNDVMVGSPVYCAREFPL